MTVVAVSQTLSIYCLISTCSMFCKDQVLVSKHSNCLKQFTKQGACIKVKKVNNTYPSLIRVGRGSLEGDITSPHLFNMDNWSMSAGLLTWPKESRTRNLSKDRSYGDNSLAGSVRVGPRRLMCPRVNLMFIPMTQRLLSMDCGKLVVVFGSVMDQTTISAHTFQTIRSSTERNSR